MHHYQTLEITSRVLGALENSTCVTEEKRLFLNYTWTALSNLCLSSIIFYSCTVQAKPYQYPSFCCQLPFRALSRLQSLRMTRRHRFQKFFYNFHITQHKALSNSRNLYSATLWTKYILNVLPDSDAIPMSMLFLPKMQLKNNRLSLWLSSFPSF